MSGRWGRAPLRVRLVATLVLLVVGALTIAGFAATASLRRFVLQRVDAQLTQVAFPGPGGRGGGGRGLPPSYWFRESDAVGNVLGGNGPDGFAPDVRQVNYAEATRRDGRPFTMRAGVGGTPHRVVATFAPNGNVRLVGREISDELATVNRLMTLQLVIGAVVVAALGAIGWVMVRRSLRPLAEVEATAVAIAGGDLARRVPDADPHTEVGRLAGAFNEMLHRIEEAFRERAESEEEARRSEERMRRFVADASHELRTPLTSIRGFAELYRQGATTPEEMPRLMRRIEDEGARMGLLVDDLLLLARLDEERPLASEPVDLVALAADAVHDARALDPAREITLDVAEGAYEVTGDEARLRQVLGNLTSNALRHTPAGTPVEVALRRDGGDAVVEVVDHGPGLGDGDAARVFERFYRADRARSRAEGGSGLGLAIVAALVAAHGGTVEAGTTPGGGATFRLRLPVG